ncbi:hypothetical protein FRC06_010650 [Ceratobasidium sp. 370]|nr:hypothetical protein FRC06_010650 [Ceratobasidium sp. 370]
MEIAGATSARAGGAAGAMASAAGAASAARIVKNAANMELIVIAKSGDTNGSAAVRVTAAATSGIRMACTAATMTSNTMCNSLEGLWIIARHL